MYVPTHAYAYLMGMFSSISKMAAPFYISPSSEGSNDTCAFLSFLPLYFLSCQGDVWGSHSSCGAGAHSLGCHINQFGGHLVVVLVNT